jgi:hypothetical protein
MTSSEFEDVVVVVVAPANAAPVVVCSVAGIQTTTHYSNNEKK